MHPVLLLRELRHARVKLLARDVARRILELLLHPRERARVAVLLHQVGRRAVLLQLLDARQQPRAAAKVDQRALVNHHHGTAPVVEGL